MAKQWQHARPDSLGKEIAGAVGHGVMKGLWDAITVVLRSL